MSKDQLMDRRRFFKSSFSKIADIGTKHAQKKVEHSAKGWIRPPYAANELDFLLNCSRCGECIKACPQQVIFELPLHCGSTVVSTPAMDIPNKACELCSDWPCVSACKDKALVFPVLNRDAKECTQASPLLADEQESISTDPISLPLASECPPMASAKVNSSQCIPYSGPECGACRDSCPIEKVLTWHNEQPSIDSSRCVGCGQCVQTCITMPKAIEIGHFDLNDEQVCNENS